MSKHDDAENQRAALLEFFEHLREGVPDEVMQQSLGELPDGHGLQLTFCELGDETKGMTVGAAFEHVTTGIRTDNDLARRAWVRLSDIDERMWAGHEAWWREYTSDVPPSEQAKLQGGHLLVKLQAAYDERLFSAEPHRKRWRSSRRRGASAVAELLDHAAAFLEREDHSVNVPKLFRSGFVYRFPAHAEKLRAQNAATIRSMIRLRERSGGGRPTKGMPSGGKWPVLAKWLNSLGLKVTPDTLSKARSERRRKKRSVKPKGSA